MKMPIMLLSLALPDSGLACPPLNGHPVAVAQREQAFRASVDAADAIVYAVVEQPITTRKRTTGILRILHVYRGDLVAGQRLKMRYALPTPRCPIYVPKDYVFSQARGTYGVALISGRVGKEAMAFTGFQGKLRVDYMIDRGLIASAQSRLPAPAASLPPYFQ